MNRLHKDSSISVEPTKDGSTTLYSGRFNQHYHNPNGAVAESRHVFFDTPALPEFFNKNSTINIFETGFGSGLNLVLLMDYLKKNVQPVTTSFYSIEAFPIDADIALDLNFGDELSYLRPNKRLCKIFNNLNPGLNTFTINEHITLHLFISLFDELSDRDFNTIKPIDFVFHDAFSPGVNPALWDSDVFNKIKSVCLPDAVLSTYCAASSARAAMAVAGWYPARAKGALGKREMTVASPNPEKITSFKKINHKKLAERYRRGDFKS